MLFEQMYMSDTIIKWLNECKNGGAVWMSEYNLIVKGRVLFKIHFPFSQFNVQAWQ